MATYSEQEYYYKADNLSKISCGTLQTAFRNRWRTLTGSEWNALSSPQAFIDKIGKDQYRRMMAFQRKSVENGVVEEWDVSLLNSILVYGLKPDYSTISSETVTKWEKENEAVKRLSSMRNKLAHNSKSKLTREQYQEMETNFRESVLTFDFVTQNQVDKMISNAGITTSVAALEQSKKIQEKGEQAFAKQNYEQAISFYDEALQVPSLLPLNKCPLYEKRAKCNFQLDLVKKTKSPRSPSLFRQPEKDALDALECNEASWRAHHILGKIYKMKRDTGYQLEKALEHLNRALAIAPGQQDVKLDLDICKLLAGVFLKDQHMDPRDLPMTFNEVVDVFGQMTGLKFTQEEFIELNKKSEQFYPGHESFFRGQQYLYGWNVQQSYEEAARYFAASAQQNHSDGIYHLAILYKKGQGVTQDLNYAFELFSRAAAMPPKIRIPNTERELEQMAVVAAQAELGRMYEEGIGVPMDSLEAFRWYKEATGNGSGVAANNLANMYYKGEVEHRDEKKAEFYWRVAVERGDPHAAFSLFHYYRGEMEVGQARAMFEKSIELGNDKLTLIRDNVYEFLEETQEMRDEMELDVLLFEKTNELSTSGLTFRERYERVASAAHPSIKTYIDSINKVNFPQPTADGQTVSNNNPKTWAGKLSKLDLDQLSRRKLQGSPTAARILRAVECLATFLLNWGDGPPFPSGKTETLIDPLYEAFCAAHHVLSFPADVFYGIKNFVEKLLQEHGSEIGQLDKKIRLCYYYSQLAINQSMFHKDEYTMAVVKEGLKRYPDVPDFYLLLSFTHGHRQEYKEGLQVASRGVKKFPNNPGLLHERASHARLAEGDGLSFESQQRIENAYQLYLARVPKDERMVPGAYYHIGVSFFGRGAFPPPNKTREDMLLEAKRYLKLGLEAEKDQLSCHLPYDCAAKTLLTGFLTMDGLMRSDGIGNSGSFHSKPTTSKPPSTSTVTSLTSKPYLRNPRRVGIIRQHRFMMRQRQKKTHLMSTESTTKSVDFTAEPDLEHKLPRTLSQLKSIELDEMDPTEDHIYENRILNLTIIDEPMFGFAAVHLVAADDSNNATRVAVYNIEQNEHTRKNLLGFGCRFSVINPYMRLALDGVSGIRVDDPKCLIYNEKAKSMCRYCGEEGALRNCAKCKWAKYCGRECQVMDWEVLNHKLICKQM